MNRFTSSLDRILLPVVFFWLLVMVLLLRFPEHLAPQYLWLAESFAAGQLHISPEISGGPFMDQSVFAGRAYFSPGPLPALLMVPFVRWVSAETLITQLQLSVLLLAYWAAYCIGRRVGLSGRAAHWLTLSFLLGSVAVGVVSSVTPWHFANLLTAALLLMAVREHVGSDRPYLIGLWIALAMTVRVTAGAAVIPFFLLVAFGRSRSGRRLRDLALLLAPLVVVALLLSGYNWLRFDSPFESGYGLHDSGPGPMRDRMEQLGLFSPAHLLRNVYYYFLAPPLMEGWLPVVNSHGMGLFMLSPLYLLVFVARRRGLLTLGVLIATVLQLGVFLTFFSAGYEQFGPRYTLDFLPLWFLLLAYHFRERKLSDRHRLLIACSASLNCLLYVIYTAWHW